MKKRIWITTQFIGFHQWVAAPPEVAFLRSLHRHVFKVKVEFSVTHGDRDLEFFMVQQAVNLCIHKELLPAFRASPGQSCEMLAEFLLIKLQEAKYPCLSVEVSEDGENGAIVEAAL